MNEDTLYQDNSQYEDNIKLVTPIQVDNKNQPDKKRERSSVDEFTDLVLKYAEIVVREAHKKMEEYPTPGNHVLGLLLQVASQEGLREWEVYRSWMKRHLVAFEYLADRNGHPDLIEKRLRDLLGYMFLALELNEYMRGGFHDDNWEKFRAMSKSVPREK